MCNTHRIRSISRTLRDVMILVVTCLYLPLLMASKENLSTARHLSTDVIEGVNTKDSKQNLKISICLTGQLLRLEILSKVRNLIAYNSAILGHKIDLFILLDNNVTEAKQTFWRHDYSKAIYRNMTTKTLQKYVEKHVRQSISAFRGDKLNMNLRNLNHSPVVVRVILAPPVQSNYTIRDGRVPVGDKTGPNGEGLPTVGEFEPAAERFQNNMRWMGGLRSCVKWVQKTESEQKWFYDVVVRLRDDSFLLGPWPITADKYLGAFVTAAVAPNFGVNDHNFAVDRKWADTVFRGITEDYYFNETLDLYSWTNTEHRIFKILTSKNIPIRTNNVCEQPVAHLRGLINNTHWRLHPTYSELMLIACEGGKSNNEEVKDAPSLNPPVDGAVWNNMGDTTMAYVWRYFKGILCSLGITSHPDSALQLNLYNNERQSILTPKRMGLKKFRREGMTSSTCCPLEWIAALKAGKAEILA